MKEFTQRKSDFKLLSYLILSIHSISVYKAIEINVRPHVALRHLRNKKSSCNLSCVRDPDSHLISFIGGGSRFMRPTVECNSPKFNKSMIDFRAICSSIYWHFFPLLFRWTSGGIRLVPCAAAHFDQLTNDENFFLPSSANELNT